MKTVSNNVEGVEDNVVVLWLELGLILILSPMVQNSEARNAQVTFAKKPQMKISSLNKLEHGYLIHIW